MDQSTFRIKFKFNEETVNVWSKDGKYYTVSVNDSFVGRVIPDLGENGLRWVTMDLISDELVAEIGRRIENELD